MLFYVTIGDVRLSMMKKVVRIGYFMFGDVRLGYIR